MLKYVYLCLELVTKIAKDGTPFAKGLAIRVTDTILDYFEEYASATETTIDDELLKLIRRKLAIPEEPGEPGGVTPKAQP